MGGGDKTLRVCVLSRFPTPKQLSELYGVPPCADPRQFLSHLARRQGRLRPGGLPDPHAAAVALLRDWTRWVSWGGAGGVSPHPEPLFRWLEGCPCSLTNLGRGLEGVSPSLPDPPFFCCSGKISYYTHPPETWGVQLEAQILTTLGPALDLEALERGDAEALAGEK